MVAHAVELGDKMICDTFIVGDNVLLCSVSLESGMIDAVVLVDAIDVAISLTYADVHSGCHPCLQMQTPACNSCIEQT